jgi:ParB/RepB/Spo0J family partition protein
MNTFNKRIVEIEISCIEMTFAHIRIANALQLKKLISSIDTCGQLTSIIVVPAASSNHFTLIDGYLRIDALKKLRQDVVKAEVWECSEVDSLLFLLANHGQRQWEAFEEAQALRELQTHYHLSQEQIAKRIGRAQSWVSHRIALLDALPDPLIQAVMKGQISAWSAQRILVPIARAIPLHAEYLLDYLRAHPHSTRELSFFFNHYQKANKVAREKMVMQPDLFFKAQKALQAEDQAKLLKAGPEGQWRFRLMNINDQIKQIERLVPQLFYERQDPKISRALREPLEQIQRDLNEVLIQSRRLVDDRQDEASNHYHALPIWQELPTH